MDKKDNMKKEKNNHTANTNRNAATIQTRDLVLLKNNSKADKLTPAYQPVPLQSHFVIS